jgi:hypothetical protein
MKKIIINASNIFEGGALNYLEWFIKNKKLFKYNLIFLVNEKLKKFFFNQNVIFAKNPSKSFKAKQYIKKIIEEKKPDLIFTLFGPSYINFKKKHLMGFADSWVTCSDIRVYFKSFKYNIFLYAYKYLECKYKLYWLKKNNYLFVENSTLKKKVIKALNYSKNKIFVVPNIIAANLKKKTKFKKDKINILYCSSYRKHKNFEIIPFLINFIKSRFPKIKFCFIVTIDQKKIKTLSFYKKIISDCNKKYLKNIGVIKRENINRIYKNSHFAILPSHIETFSSNIIESIENSVPIILNKLDKNNNQFKKNFLQIDYNNKLEIFNLFNRLFYDKNYYFNSILKQKKFYEQNKVNRAEVFRNIFKNIIK